jgi:hypothetical protein
MTSTDTLKAASRTTTAILNLILKMTGGPTPTAITNGLPAGSIYLPVQRLVLGGTPCTVPLFRETMCKVATEMNVDVLVVRHGTYPEVFDVTQRRESLLAASAFALRGFTTLPWYSACTCRPPVGASDLRIAIW